MGPGEERAYDTFGYILVSFPQILRSKFVLTCVSNSF